MIDSTQSITSLWIIGINLAAPIHRRLSRPRISRVSRHFALNAIFDVHSARRWRGRQAKEDCCSISSLCFVCSPALRRVARATASKGRAARSPQENINRYALLPGARMMAVFIAHARAALVSSNSVYVQTNFICFSLFIILGIIVNFVLHFRLNLVCHRKTSAEPSRAEQSISAPNSSPMKH